MTKIKILSDRIIFDGHADTQRECETTTLLCDNLAKSADFKTIKYEEGYAEFEKIGGIKKPEDLMFAPGGNYLLTVNFDSHISKVSISTAGGDIECTASGSSYDTMVYNFSSNNTPPVFTVTLDSGYTLDDVAISDDGSGSVTINGNSFTGNNLCSMGDCTLTITSKLQSSSTKKIKTRVQNKHDTSTNWAKATTFVPLAGEVIVYDDLKRIKIGDGQTTVTNLDFFDNYLRNNVDNMKASNNGLWELDPDMNFTKLAAIPGVKVYSSIGGTNITSQLGTGKYIDSNCVNSIFKSTETVINMPTSSTKTIIYKKIVVTEGTKYYVSNPMVSTSPLSAYDIIVVSGGYPSRYCSSTSQFTLFSQASGGKGIDTITELDMQLSTDQLTYDSTTGLLISGVGRVTYGSGDNIATTDFNSYNTIPLKAGTNISMNVTEDGTALEVGFDGTNGISIPAIPALPRNGVQIVYTEGETKAISRFCTNRIGYDLYAGNSIAAAREWTFPSKNTGTLALTSDIDDKISSLFTYADNVLTINL